MFEKYADDGDDAGMLRRLLRVEVPFGKHQGQQIGTVPTRYLDSEVPKWERSLFVRQCERAMDLTWEAMQYASASALRMIEIPSNATLNEVFNSIFTDDGQLITPGLCLGFDSNQRMFDRIESHLQNGIELNELAAHVAVRPHEEARFRACIGALKADGYIDVCEGLVIDLRASE